MRRAREGVTAPSDELDIWPAVRSAYACVFASLDEYLRRSWFAWTILFLAAFAGPLVDQYVAFALGWIVQWIAFAFVGSAFAVGWHRKLLLNERTDGRPRFQLDKRENRWLGTVVILYGGFFVLSQAADILAARGAETASLIVFFAGLAALLYFGSRIFLALPLAAIDSRHHVLRRSLDLTRRDWWRVAVGAILLMLPAGVVEWLLREIGSVVATEGSTFDRLAFVFFAVGVMLLEIALLAAYAAAALRQLDPEVS
jgi:hypothetical protein